MSKILFIGLDAVDWELLSAKAATGTLPHLARLMATGVSGPLRSIDPLFSPALWTTIATGKRPHEHGITGFTQPDDSGIGLRPYDSTSRRVPALWNMLTHAKKTAHVVGWWTTAPAEAIQGVLVDETFRIAHRPAQEAWEPAPRSVSPASTMPLLAQERVHPQQLSESLLRGLVPKLYEIDPSTDFRIAGIAKILAEDLTTLQVALRLMAQGTWDFTTLYLIGLDSLSHLGMRYRPPAFPGENERDCELYGQVIDRAYELYDRWVGQLVAAAGDEATIVIASDHGFYHDARKPLCLGIEETAPAVQHAPIGTLIMKGPALHQGRLLEHATILDLCPTLLTLLQLPVGRDMPGKVLSNAFLKTPSISKISSWDRHWTPISSASEPSSQATEAALRQLIALGYLQEMPADKQTAVHHARCDQLFHRALAFRSEERLDQALPLLEQAWSAVKKGPQFLTRTDILGELASAYFQVGKKRSAAACFYRLVRARRRDAQQAFHTFWQKTTTVPTTNLSFSEAWEVRRLLARANVNEEGMRFLMLLARFLAHASVEDLWLMISYAEEHAHDSFANLNAGLFALEMARQAPAALSSNDRFKIEEKGIALLRQLATLRPEGAAPLAFLADHFHQTQHGIEAESCAREALRRDALHAPAWLALAATLTYQKRWEEAWEAAQQARRSFLQRRKAYLLLATIARQGKKEPARAKRYEAMAKKMEQVFQRLFFTNSSSPRSLWEQKQTASHKHFSREEKTIASHAKKSFPKSALKNSFSKPDANAPLIVTGLPRSGTSLLMQMLAAGGIPLDTDHERHADEHNPHGYFEHEKVKTIGQNANFLQAGKATKVVIPLLFQLPLHAAYRVLWIRRDLEEVIASQHRMAGLQASAQELRAVYHHYELKTAEHLARAGWPVLELHYATVLQNPHHAAQSIATFLQKELDVDAMAAAVEPRLYRERRASRSDDL